MNFKKEIENWKEKHGLLNHLVFEDEKEAFFSPPNRKVLKLVFSKAQSGGPIGMTESYVKNCYLGGSVTKEEILSEKNTVYLAQLAASIDGLLGTKQAQIKKL